VLARILDSLDLYYDNINFYKFSRIVSSLRVALACIAGHVSDIVFDTPHSTRVSRNPTNLSSARASRPYRSPTLHSRVRSDDECVPREFSAARSGDVERALAYSVDCPRLERSTLRGDDRPSAVRVLQLHR
jgi:hypothetical protein